MKCKRCFAIMMCFALLFVGFNWEPFYVRAAAGGPVSKKVTPVRAVLKEITIPSKASFDEVLTDENREVTVIMSNGSKKLYKVIIWSMPRGFTSLNKNRSEFNLTGKVQGTKITAKAHLKILFNNSGDTESTYNGSSNIVAVGSFAATGSVPEKSLSLKEYAYQVTKELSDGKYKGRLSGTLEYRSAATYLADVFRSLDLAQIDGANSYLQKYSVSLAQLNSMPTLKINGTDLVMYKDFKLHGNTPSSKIKIDSTVFVGNGYKEDYQNIDVKGKNVLFLADTKNNASAQSMGVLDRVNIAYAKGAVSALIIPNKYMPISTSEKPIKYDKGNMPCIYITKNVAENLLKINVDSAALGTQSNSTIEAGIDIARYPRTDAYNVLGMIKGKDTSKTFVISASLDSYGSLPDGRVFNGAVADASGVGVVAALAKYYSQNQPNYNILFAAFGSQTTLREGSRYFVSNYKNIKNILADIDIYDVGNPGTYPSIFNSVGKQYTDLHATISKISNTSILDEGEDVNYPFGNNYEFSTKNIPNVFIRYGENLDSLNDKIDKVDVNALDKVINHVISIANGYPAGKSVNSSNENSTSNTSTNFDESKVGHEFVASINETLNTYETNHIKFYYEDNFKEAIKAAINDPNGPDKVYEEDEWWNFYPSLPSDKLKIYCVDQWDEGWQVTNRLDKKGTGEQSGGYQSFTDYSLSIVRINQVTNSNEIKGTLAHEFNHICANYNGFKTDSNTDNQEISGHVYAFTVGMSTNGNIKKVYKDKLIPEFISNKVSFTDEKSWDEFTENNNRTLKNATQWNEHYDKLACMEYYIWNTYGKEKARAIQYEFYKNPRPSVKSVVEKQLSITFQKLLIDCFNWYNG